MRASAHLSRVTIHVRARMCLFACAIATLLQVSAAAIIQAQVPAATIDSQQPKEVRDSLDALLTALTRLKVFEHQHSLLVRGPGARIQPTRIPIFGYCEISVGDYCYGPENGGLTYGGLGTRVASRLLVPDNFMKVFRKRSESFIDKYAADLKKQRKRVPGDRWLNGEVVRVEMERGDPFAAMNSLKDCKAEVWWCAALRAYVIHSAGAWIRADSAFGDALAKMPESERCAWLDPTWVVQDRAFARSFGAASCAEKLRLANRIWWLSDPLYLITGNERRAEHLARAVELILLQEYRQHSRMTPAMLLRAKPTPSDRPMVVSPTASLFEAEAADVPVTDDLAPPAIPDATLGGASVVFRTGYPDLVMRTGTPKYTAREEGTIALIAQYPSTRASFVPSARAATNPLAAVPSDWSVTDPDAFEFMSSWIRPVHDLDFQVAYFRRGASAALAVATDVRSDTLLGGRALDAAVFLQRDFDAPVRSEKQREAGVLRFLMNVPAESALASIEVRTDAGATGRVRFGSGPPPMLAQRASLSDVLLVEAREPLPLDLTSAQTRMLGTTTLRQGSTVGVFWEMYGLNAGEQPKISIVASPEPAGLLARVARVVTSQASTDSLVIQWEETPVGGRAIEPRAVNLDLRALKPGGYTLSVTVELQGQERITSRRRVEIQGG